jgi:UDP-3-O-[3-hydroxymyristoyl] glucosamine N-acyltransferase
VGARSVIGPGTELHPGVYVGADVQMGPDCVLWPGVVIRERVTLGARVVVHANTTIGGDGFGYLQRDGRHVKIPQIGTVVVEDDVEIGAGTCIDRARTGVTRIGRGTKIDNLVQVAHNVTVGEGCIIVAQCGISGSAWLGRYVVLAGQVGVVDHVKIGARAVVTAQSGVAKSWPEGQVLRGSPAREAHEQARLDAAVRRLPKLNEQVRELQQRVERLESATDDRA